MAADAAVSLGVVVAGLMILWTGWIVIDPLMGLAIALAIAVSSWSLLRESLALAMDAVPRGIEKDQVGRYLASLPGVSLVHHLHIWPMSTTEIALTAHVVRPDAGLDDEFLAHAARALRERFGIGHVTLQVEHGEPRR
jgi:cobalt-zinc-cadmium efflux system protein